MRMRIYDDENDKDAKTAKAKKRKKPRGKKAKKITKTQPKQKDLKTNICNFARNDPLCTVQYGPKSIPQIASASFMWSQWCPDKYAPKMDAMPHKGCFVVRTPISFLLQNLSDLG